MSLRIRTAAASDAESIGGLVREFQAYLRGLGDRTAFSFTAEAYIRDGFGPNPAFSGIVAEVDGAIAGYLLYHFGYDTDRGVRLLHVIDLYVKATNRRAGIGGALMRTAAVICRKAGGGALIWEVFAPNALAFQFYEHLGAERVDELKIMRWLVPTSDR